MGTTRRNVAFTPFFRWQLAGVVLLIAACIAVWGGGGARMRLRLRALRLDGNETTGVITETGFDGDRYVVRYRFDVDGATHEGEMHAPARRYADRYVRGDTTPVAYLAENPLVSVPRAKREIDDSFIDGNTGPDLLRALAYTLGISLLLIALLIAALRQRRLLSEGNILGATIMDVDERKRVKYQFTTPAGELHARRVSLRRPPSTGERVDVCWMPGRPAKSRLRSELRYVKIVD
ncbi:MAG: hypothetical protein QOI24_2517 [Acidobacteriota bacterium]|jgi:hypothetical protein|nr:hypothetical protein [Acidobacteriota bacterium]